MWVKFFYFNFLVRLFLSFSFLIRFNSKFIKIIFLILLLLHLPKHIRRKKINIFYPSIFLSFLDFLSLHHPSSQRNDLGFVSTHNLIICPTFYKAASSLSLLSLYGLFVTKKVMRWLLHNLPYLLQGFSILPLLSFLWNFRNKESDEVVTS